jgi:hypothetical protein
MKKLLSAFVVIMIATTLHAQTGFEIGANVGTGTKTGAKSTYGVDAQVNIPAATKLAITGSAGYQHLNFKYGNVKSDHGFMPLYAGLLLNLTANLMLHGQLGYALSTASGGGGEFSYAPSIHYLLGSNLKLGLKYMSIDTYNAVLLRLAYTLGASKK